MPKTAAEKRAAFRELHRAGCFVLPNPWDIGSARMFERLGFSALASTSSGYAWTTGRPDYGVTRADVLAHLAALSAAVDLPVNADFEAGFADDPEGVAESVRLAIEAGVAGLSIEDRGPAGLYDKATALERLGAARRAVEAAGGGAILVARTEILLDDPDSGLDGDRQARRFRRRRRRLPLRARRAQAGRHPRHGRGGRAEAASTCWSWTPPCPCRPSPISASGASASAARWRGSAGRPSSARPNR